MRAGSVAAEPSDSAATCPLRSAAARPSRWPSSSDARVAGAAGDLRCEQPRFEDLRRAVRASEHRLPRLTTAPAPCCAVTGRAGARGVGRGGDARALGDVEQQLGGRVGALRGAEDARRQRGHARELARSRPSGGQEQEHGRGRVWAGIVPRPWAGLGVGRVWRRGSRLGRGLCRARSRGRGGQLERCRGRREQEPAPRRLSPRGVGSAVRSLGGDVALPRGERWAPRRRAAVRLGVGLSCAAMRHRHGAALDVHARQHAASHAGIRQVRSPMMLSTAGSSRQRTTSASRNTALARLRPNSLITRLFAEHEREEHADHDRRGRGDDAPGQGEALADRALSRRASCAQRSCMRETRNTS